MIKVCTKCRISKPVDHYYRLPHTHDGLQPLCKVCHSAYSRARYHLKSKDPAWRDKERLRSRLSYDKHGGPERTPEIRKRAAIKSQEWRVRHRQKARAQDMVQARQER